MSRKFIFNFAPNGLIPTKAMTPHVPISPDEIIEQVLDACELGVNMVHLHARHVEAGTPAYEKEIYGEIVSGIRRRNRDVVLGVSTSGRTFSEFEQRSQCLELTGDAKPDFGSLTLGSLNFAKQASVNEPEMIQRLAKKMLDAGIRPELEVFDLGMLNYAHYLIRRGLVKPPWYFNLLLGNVAGAQADPMSLGLLASRLPAGAIWASAGLGDCQLTANTLALASGGGVRVGLEDNIYFDFERQKLASNRELVTRISEIAAALGLAPYSAKTARALVCP
jgi:3-keto-5-aminohexanoate cleavage enzyme